MNRQEERLQKYISRCGYASRRKAETLIAEGKVLVNGKYVTEVGTKIRPGIDKVKIGGVPIVPEDHEYYLLFKPKGVVTTASDPQNRETVTEYMKGVRTRVYPVGRLDLNTEGLLLLTNDGSLAQKLMHPSFEIVKTYEVRVRGRINDEHLERISQGIPLEDGMTSPAVITDLGYDVKTDLTTIEIRIHEGKNRQVRRMFEYFRYRVHNLKRTAYANLTLRGMKRGQYRALTRDELKELYEAVGASVGKEKRVRKS